MNIFLWAVWAANCLFLSTNSVLNTDCYQGVKKFSAEQKEVTHLGLLCRSAVRSQLERNNTQVGLSLTLRTAESSTHTMICEVIVWKHWFRSEWTDRKKTAGSKHFISLKTEECCLQMGSSSLCSYERPPLVVFTTSEQEIFTSHRHDVLCHKHELKSFIWRQ